MNVEYTVVLYVSRTGRDYDNMIIKTDKTFWLIKTIRYTQTKVTNNFYIYQSLGHKEWANTYTCMLINNHNISGSPM